jgi:SAM-dependent methyltransferase
VSDRAAPGAGAPTELEVPTPEAEWDALAAAWADSPTQHFLRAWSDAANAALLERVLGELRPARALKTDLFDEAVASGIYPHLRELARSVAGVDVSPTVIAAARSRYPELEAHRCDVRRLPFRDGEFDFVFSNSTLDHFSTKREIAAAIAELARVLAPGGRLVVTLDNPLNPLIALRNALPFGLLNRTGLVPYFVGATCGPRSLRRMFMQAGLDVEGIDTVMHFPRAVAAVVVAIAARVGDPAQLRLLKLLHACERLHTLPSRLVTGHFIAASGRKRR